MTNLFDLTGKTAIITGGNKGIGRGMTLGLAAAGADIIVASATLDEQGSAIEQEVLALGRKFKAYRVDLSDREALYTFVKRVLNDHDRIDILVNNAGTIMRKPAAEHPDEY